MSSQIRTTNLLLQEEPQFILSHSLILFAVHSCIYLIFLKTEILYFKITWLLILLPCMFSFYFIVNLKLWQLT